MFFRILWLLVVTWLVAGLLRLLLGGWRRLRRRPDPDARKNARPGPTDLPYSRDDVVDAEFSEVDEAPRSSSDRK
jgi:hypothetical protein